MAYITQQEKKVISQKLKTIIPKQWKWSLRIRNGHKLELVIRKASIDLIEAFDTRGFTNPDKKPTYKSINSYMGANFSSYTKAPEMVKRLFARIQEALDTGNYDKSDSMSDYFDVGHYTSIIIGEFDKPFELVTLKKAA